MRQTFPGAHAGRVHLSTNVYLPKNYSTPVPAVLVRTPYGKEDGCEIYYRYVQRGYAVVVQDVRGRNASEGEWLPNYHEVEDGDDTLNWIAAQHGAADASVWWEGPTWVMYSGRPLPAATPT